MTVLVARFKEYPLVVWYFFIAVFINKAGSLVMPFLSRFLLQNCDFSLMLIGWIFFYLGLGSVLGTLSSGKLIDKFGAYKIILISLLSSSFFLVLLSFIRTFELFCLFIFLFSFFADMLRPAIFSILKDYTTVENRIKSFTLIRVASNLGLIIGPLISSYIIINNSYEGVFGSYRLVFFLDALTCLIASLIIGYFIHERKFQYQLKEDIINKFNIKMAPLKDKVFLLNNIVACISGILFFQFFSVFPLYFSKQTFGGTMPVEYFFSLMALLVAVFELVFVNFYLKLKYFNTLVIGLGLAFFVLGYLSLTLLSGYLGVFIYVLCIGLGAMHTFPFSANIVIERSHLHQEGVFMAFFQISYGFSQMISGKLNTIIVEYWGFTFNWGITIILGIIGLMLNHMVYLAIRKEKKELTNRLDKYF
ncbi:MAG: MFS transporter [Limnohabitans sp.]|nr:MFS transporter [Limnohabitans sp.]